VREKDAGARQTPKPCAVASSRQTGLYSTVNNLWPWWQRRSSCTCLLLRCLRDTTGDTIWGGEESEREIGGEEGTGQGAGGAGAGC
jgi:hypothetical protein